LSSLPAEPTFAALVTTSLEVLSAECPEAYTRICQLLAPHEVCLEVGAETVSIRFQPTLAEVLPLPQEPAVFFSAAKQTLLDLADARYTLESAIMRDLLHVRGKMDHLIQFYESLQLYIQGAVRCPSFPGLLTYYRFHD
jgi:hypothetical protein